MKKLIGSSMLFLTFFGCSSALPHPTIFPPNPYTVEDAGSLPLIDQDAYSVNIPPVDEIAIHLQIADGSAPNGELIAPLRHGELAPFNGVLFNGPAVARVSVEFRGQAEQCRIDRMADSQRLVEQARHDINSLFISATTQTQIYQTEIASRNSEIDRLYHYIQTNQNSNSSGNYSTYALFAGGGLAVGLAVSLAFLIFAH